MCIWVLHVEVFSRVLMCFLALFGVAQHHSKSVKSLMASQLVPGLGCPAMEGGDQEASSDHGYYFAQMSTKFKLLLSAMSAHVAVRIRHPSKSPSIPIYILRLLVRNSPSPLPSRSV
jgi:hypothetical protein